jgi:hypothetical protein
VVRGEWDFEASYPMDGGGSGIVRLRVI